MYSTIEVNQLYVKAAGFIFKIKGKWPLSISLNKSNSVFLQNSTISGAYPRTALDLFKNWEKSLLSDISSLPQSTANLATGDSKLLSKSPAQMNPRYWSVVSKVVFPLTMHFQTLPTQYTWLYKWEKVAEGGTVRGRYTHVFPKDFTPVHAMKLALCPQYTRCPTCQWEFASSQIRVN